MATGAKKEFKGETFWILKKNFVCFWDTQWHEIDSWLVELCTTKLFSFIFSNFEFLSIINLSPSLDHPLDLQLSSGNLSSFRYVVSHYWGFTHQGTCANQNPGLLRCWGKLNPNIWCGDPGSNFLSVLISLSTLTHCEVPWLQSHIGLWRFLTYRYLFGSCVIAPRFWAQISHLLDECLTTPSHSRTRIRIFLTRYQRLVYVHNCSFWATVLSCTAALFHFSKSVTVVNYAPLSKSVRQGSNLRHTAY